MRLLLRLLICVLKYWYWGSAFIKLVSSLETETDTTSHSRSQKEISYSLLWWIKPTKVLILPIILVKPPNKPDIFVPKKQWWNYVFLFFFENSWRIQHACLSQLRMRWIFLFLFIVFPQIISNNTKYKNCWTNLPIKWFIYWLIYIQNCYSFKSYVLAPKRYILKITKTYNII